MSTGTLVTIQPGGTVTRTRIENKKGAQLKDFQKAVDGYIERVKVRFEGKTRDAYVNEDGISKRLPFNPAATAILTDLYKRNGVTLVGALVIWVPDPKPTKVAA